MKILFLLFGLSCLLGTCFAYPVRTVDVFNRSGFTATVDWHSMDNGTGETFELESPTTIVVNDSPERVYEANFYDGDIIMIGAAGVTVAYDPDQRLEWFMKGFWSMCAWEIFGLIIRRYRAGSRGIGMEG